MPVGFLTQEQRDGFGRYVDSPSREELERYFHLSDEDREAIQVLRGNHNRLGYAVLLTTVRFVGVLPDKPAAVPVEVLQVLCRQLAIPDPDCLQRYSDHRRWIHATDIQNRFGYRHFTDPGIGFRLSRWLYALCWTGTDRPGVLFERATSWLFTQKVLLPGVSQLERFIAQLRSRVEERLWFTLGRSVTEEQRLQLQDLLTVAEGNRSSRLDQLRSGPVMVSGPALIRALRRLDDVRGIGITLPAAAHKGVAASLEWLQLNLPRRKPEDDAPQEIVAKAWQKHITREDGSLDMGAYVFCTLDALRTALRRRDVFVSPSWRYADPRLGLLDGAEWLAARPIICRSLGLTIDAKTTLDALSVELDATWLAVAARLPDNPAIQLSENTEGKTELSLGALDKLDEPCSLLQLRAAVSDLMPRVDLPEILLEIAARTGFSEAFTHVSERNARADNLVTSLCAVLLGGACNTGLEPLIRTDNPALRRDRLSWVSQNYIRDDTLSAANAILVGAQSQLELAQVWGGGEVASADGMRFVVPVRTVHAGPNPKYFGTGRGVTWYNLISDQFSGLNAITVPGTLRDSLVLLAVVLEQQTELQPTQIMTDTGAYSDVVFGLFRLLGYHFSPRLADVGGTRFWRTRPDADYGKLNGLARQSVKLDLIAEHWDDLLRLAGSLKLGRVPATGIMRTLQTGDRPTRLAQALAEFGRIEKTLHTLTYIDDESKRRATLTQLNRGEGRHSLARAVFHGKRGELRQRYREGQEDQLGALGLVVNIIVLWNTLYMTAAVERLKQHGYPVLEEDLARLSPLIYEHINMLGRYSFAVPEEVARGELRPLRNPDDDL
ncbi:TPA: Tn3 family transposase [Pseudomonas aeruginosa]